MIRYHICAAFGAFMLFIVNEKVDSSTVVVEEVCSEKVEVVRQEKGGVTIAIYPENGSRANPVTLTYGGKLYGENGVSLMRKEDQGTKQSDPLIEFLKNMYNVVKNNKQGDYIKCWHSKEREGIKNAYKETPEAWEKYNKLVRNQEDYRLMGIILYGDYVVAQSLMILADGSVFHDDDIIKKENGNYRKTNDLSADQDMIWFGYIDGQRNVKDYKNRK